MARQYVDARKDYKDNLDLIEKAFQHERQDILARNETEIKRLFDDHSKMEEEYQVKKS